MAKSVPTNPALWSRAKTAAKKKHKGGSHKMPNGDIHSGKTHGKTSKKLYHFSELSKTAKKKARG